LAIAAGAFCAHPEMARWGKHDIASDAREHEGAAAFKIGHRTFEGGHTGRFDGSRSSHR
jgi:hypothetical protein